MSATLDDVMRKVRGLLRLAKSDNANESAAAAAAAQRLMEKHAISEAALAFDETAKQALPPEEDVQRFQDPLHDGGRKLASWRARLAGVLCKANGLFHYFNGQTIRIVGRASDADKVRYLFAYCEAEIDRLTRKHARGEGRTWANNFRIGCVDAISEAIERERESVRSELRTQARAAGGERALMVINQAIAKVESRYVDSRRFAYQTVRLRGTRSFGRSYSDALAREAVRRAGVSIYPSGNPTQVRGGGRGLPSGTRSLKS